MKIIYLTIITIEDWALTRNDHHKGSGLRAFVVKLCQCIIFKGTPPSIMILNDASLTPSLYGSFYSKKCPYYNGSSCALFHGCPSSPNPHLKYDCLRPCSGLIDRTIFVEKEMLWLKGIVTGKLLLFNDFSSI